MITVSNDNNEEQDAKENAQAAGGAENVVAAHEQAEADIENDPDLNSAADPADDLDEGELARLKDDTGKDDA